MTETTSAPGARAASPLHIELVDRLVARCIDDARVRGLWIEAARQADLRRPFGAVRIHAVADQPDFPALVAGWEKLLGDLGGRLDDARWSDTQRLARQLDATVTLNAAPGPLRAGVVFVIECSAFLAKRPRRAVAPLVDKTGHLTHVMSFVKA